MTINRINDQAASGIGRVNDQAATTIGKINDQPVAFEVPWSQWDDGVSRDVGTLKLDTNRLIFDVVGTSIGSSIISRGFALADGFFNLDDYNNNIPYNATYNTRTTDPDQYFNASTNLMSRLAGYSTWGIVVAFQDYNIPNNNYGTLAWESNGTNDAIYCQRNGGYIMVKARLNNVDSGFVSSGINSFSSSSTAYCIFWGDSSGVYFGWKVGDKPTSSAITGGTKVTLHSSQQTWSSQTVLNRGCVMNGYAPGYNYGMSSKFKYLYVTRGITPWG